MKLKQLLESLPYTWLQGTLEQDVTGICIDSRNYHPQELFIAIQGTKIDSHQYIDEVIEKGCRVIIMEQDLPLPCQVTGILIENGRYILAKLCANFYHHPEKKMKLIGITGTSGKTTTSFLLKGLLEAGGYQVGLIGTNGAYFKDQKIKLKNTTPSSDELYALLAHFVEEKIEIAIIEVSSQALKQQRVEGLIFDEAIWTNLTKDHLGVNEHPDMEDYLKSKKKIFMQSRYALLNRDDPYYEAMKEDLMIPYHTFGFHEESDCRIIKTLSFFYKTHFKTQGILQEEFVLGFPGNYNVMNALGALLIAQRYHVDIDILQKKLPELKVEGRFEIYRDEGKTWIIDYAHNVDSYTQLMKTIQTFPFRRVFVVIGAGGNRSLTRRQEVMQVLDPYVDYFILTEDNSRQEPVEKIVDSLKAVIAPEKVMIEYHRDEAIKKAFLMSKRNDVILVVGKGHEDTIEREGQTICFNDGKYIKSLLNHPHL